MHNRKLKQLVLVSILGVLSYLIMLIEIPLPLFPFLKLDFSDLVPLTALSLLGYGGAIAVILIRGFLHLVMLGFSAPSLIGQLGSLVASFSLVSIAACFRRKKVEHWSQRLALIVSATLTLTVAMAILNYFVLGPLFVNVTGFKLGMSYLKYVVVTVIPFNLIKGFLVMSVYELLYAKLGVWLQKQHHRLSY